MALKLRALLRFIQRRKGIVVSGTAVALVGAAVARYLVHKGRAAKTATGAALIAPKHKVALNGRKKGEINKEFFKNLMVLLKIVLPGIGSKEALLLILHTSFLITRTFVSIYVAKLDGALVKHIVEPDGKQFIWNMTKWLLLAIPATYINSMIRFLESKLGIAFRTRLVSHIYEMYMSNDTYYRVGNMDSRMANADQLLTEDAAKFCNNLAHLYSQLSKPIFDVCLMGTQLFMLSSERAGALRTSGSTFLAFVVVYLTAKALQFMSPPFGRLVAEQAVLEGDLRFVHSRLITNAEEIAFYGGHKVEKTVLEKAYTSLVKQMNLIFRSRIIYNTLEGFFMKYVWSACGLVMIAVPTFFGSKEYREAENVGGRTQTFVISRKLLIDAAEAIERIMLAYKEVTELAGYTSRVTEMITVFEDMKSEKYVKHVVKQDGQIDDTTNNEILTKRGNLSSGDDVHFDKVPIVSPNGDVLVKALSFHVRPGEHLLITGPNGCGKSSMFRILGGLWPVYGGEVNKPMRRDMFYIPQRPYLSLGNLRDQIIYPDTIDDMKSKKFTDKDLEDILEWVNLRYILEREGGWEAVKDWQDMFSGGEKQRIGMARLFYHKPKYAILDECTSAVSIDVEGKMYTHATDLGITLLTVTHRPTLWKYHNFLLQFDGEGGWKFSQLNAEARLSLKDEKSKLEASLAGLPKMQARLRELCKLLGEDSCELQKCDAEAKQEEDEQIA